MTVDGLGFWDHQSDGFYLSQTFPVGIWDAATGTLLRSSVIASGSALKASLHPSGAWRVNAVSPLYLGPGLYRIGALSSSPYTFSAGASPNEFSPFIVFDRPYVYRGGDLVMLFRLSGSSANSTEYLDAVNPDLTTNQRLFYSGLRLFRRVTLKPVGAITLSPRDGGSVAQSKWKLYEESGYRGFTHHDHRVRRPLRA